MASVESSRTPDGDIVDQLMNALDQRLDAFHDRVIRPLTIAVRALAFGAIYLVLALILVTALAIGALRLSNVYLFSQRDWLSLLVLGALFWLVGALVWRRRRPREK